LQPHLGVALLRGHIARVAPGAAGGLHQQGKQPLRRAKVAGKQRPVGLHGGHQGDAAKVVPLGHHLRAHQHVHIAGVHLGQLLLQRALGLRRVGVYARHAGGAALGGDDVAQQLRQLLFELLRAPAHGGDVGVATGRAGARHALGKAAVVAAQRAVYLVEHLVRAAMWAVALPAAGVAVQHRGEAAAVEQHQALLAALHALGNRRQQRRGKYCAARLLAHVDQAQARQRARAYAAGHLQALVAAHGRVARMPALQRGRGAAQDDLGALVPRAPQRQVARRVARALLLLVAGVMLLIDHDEP